MPTKDTLYLRLLLRLLSGVWFLLALPCISISYVCHNYAYFDGAGAVQTSAATQGGGHQPPEATGNSSTIKPIHTGRLLQVFGLGAFVSLSSILYLWVVSQRTVYRHTLQSMKIPEVLMFWALCASYVLEAVLSAYYSVVYDASPALARVLYVAPYAVFAFVYLLMVSEGRARRGAKLAPARDQIDVMLPEISLKAVDFVVAAGVIWSFYVAWGEANTGHREVVSIWSTISAKQWAIAGICLALALNDVGRHWIARKTLVWDAYEEHLKHVLGLEERRADFRVCEGIHCDVVVDLGCGSGERLKQLLTDDRLRIDPEQVLVIAVDAQLTNARMTRLRQELSKGTSIQTSQVRCYLKAQDLLADHDTWVRLCRGGGLTVVVASHALYYRHLTKDLARVVKEIPGELLVAVRGSGFRSFWAVVESVMSTNAVRPSAGQYWRDRYLPEFCREAGLVRLLAPDLDIRKSGGRPDDVIDQTIQWNEDASASTLELLSLWHGSHIRELLSGYARRLPRLDRGIYVPAEDVQFWLRRPEGEPPVEVRSKITGEYAKLKEVRRSDIALKRIPGFERRAERVATSPSPPRA